MAAESRVNPAQVKKAVAALAKHLEKVKAEGKTQLFEEDGDGDYYSVMLSTRRVPQKGSNKLVPVKIPNPLLNPDKTEICLIVKDHQGEGHKEAKKKVADMEACGVAKVLGISKLRNNYKPHEAKRQLCDSYDLFCADARVLPILPKLLGKSFFKKKKQPVPVDLTKKDWAAQIRGTRAIHQRHGGDQGGGERDRRDRRPRAARAPQVVQRAIDLHEDQRVRRPVYNALPDPDEEKAAREEEAERKAEKIAAREGGHQRRMEVALAKISLWQFWQPRVGRFTHCDHRRYHRRLDPDISSALGSITQPESATTGPTFVRLVPNLCVKPSASGPACVDFCSLAIPHSYPAVTKM